jgi:hypothetical protein
MVVSFLAILFLLIVLVIAVVGFKAVIMQGRSPADAGTEKCSICLARHPLDRLVARQVGDHRLLYFCRQCIAALGEDLSRVPRGEEAPQKDTGR